MSAKSAPLSASALSGVRVLDLSRILAGPWASQIFGDLGAEVIKVENPEGGDDTRRWGPPFLHDNDGAATDAAYYLAANRNKKSVAIDFSNQDGADIVRRLAATSQIFIENYKVGGLKKYGLDYETIRQINPAIVYCSITGFGQSGPYAQRPGYDFMIQAMGGMMSVTGQPDGKPGGEPMRAGVAVVDLFSGMYAATAMLAALRHAERTGEGQQLDVALLDCEIALLANQASNYLVTGVAPGRIGNAHPNIAPYQVFAVADGHIVVAVGNDGQFKAFVATLGAPALAADPDFATNGMRVTNRDRLTATLAPLLAERTAADWLTAFSFANVPAGPINTIKETFDDPHTVERDLTASLTRDDAGRASITRHPVKFSATPAELSLAPPKLGEHTKEVLSTMFIEKELDDLFAKKVVA
jgi:crotonobetainyl-CoA:carnitine CoA-transferase CaiB-like acyl-CoA transferase